MQQHPPPTRHTRAHRRKKKKPPLSVMHPSKCRPPATRMHRKYCSIGWTAIPVHVRSHEAAGGTWQLPGVYDHGRRCDADRLRSAAAAAALRALRSAMLTRPGRTAGARPRLPLLPDPTLEPPPPVPVVVVARRGALSAVVGVRRPGPAVRLPMPEPSPWPAADALFWRRTRLTRRRYCSRSRSSTPPWPACMIVHVKLKYSLCTFQLLCSGTASPPSYSRHSGQARGQLRQLI